MFRKTPSKDLETTIFQELRNELHPHLVGVNGHLKGLMDRHAKVIFCVMLLLIVASFILTFFVLKPDSENQAENFKKDLKAMPGELSGEFSALQDLTLRAAEMAELKSEIERIIAQDSISKTDSAYLEKAIEQLQYFNNHSNEN
jgi:lipopolysaccharide export LptBFGC system permease protein LptF